MNKQVPQVISTAMKSQKNSQTIRKQVLGHHHSMVSIQKPDHGSSLANYSSVVPQTTGVKGVLQAARNQVNDSNLSSNHSLQLVG